MLRTSNEIRHLFPNCVLTGIGGGSGSVKSIGCCYSVPSSDFAGAAGC